MGDRIGSEHWVDDVYDEEADSDFQADHAVSEESASSSQDDDNEATQDRNGEPSRKRKKVQPPKERAGIAELDSGDEVTIQQNKRSHRRKPGIQHGDQSDHDAGEWRAKTRAMRERDKDERKRNKLATAKGSTIDVEKIWEEMNKPIPPTFVHVDDHTMLDEDLTEDRADTGTRADTGVEKENVPALVSEEMITIKRTYEFAGETHTQEKSVPRSSAEARLWLSEQNDKIKASPEARGALRPLRKFSRFDPNLSNLIAFAKTWQASSDGAQGAKGPRLNVVEKSKMDWAAHVDNEGLQEELDQHAKAKGGYLNRMDFLHQVGQRKEEDARSAKTKA